MNILKKVLALLIIFSLIWSIYIFYEFRNESRLVYVKKEDMEMTATTAGKGSNSRVNIYLKNIHDVKTNHTLYESSTVKIMSYTWDSKLSVNRAIFLDKEKIRGADTLYMYLYKTDYKVILSSTIFGLSASEPPSDLYLYADIIRSTTQLGVLFILSFITIFYYIENKLLKKTRKEKENSNLKFWYLISVIVLLFIIIS